MHDISLNYIDLNKACSLIVAYWSVNTIPYFQREKFDEEKQIKIDEVEAEIQKRLTKAVPYFRGQMCQKVGLRYAPEIRFYKDNTYEQQTDQREQAKDYLKQIEEENK